MLIGFFEGLDSERGTAWRVANSLCLQQFLGYGLVEADTGSGGDLGPEVHSRRQRRSPQLLVIEGPSVLLAEPVKARPLLTSTRFSR